MNCITLHEAVYALSIDDIIGSANTKKYIIYAPKAGICCCVDECELEKLLSLKSTDDNSERALIDSLKSTSVWDICRQKSDSYTAASILYIIPNYRCNLACSYCYAASGRSDKEIDKAHIIDAIKSFFDDKIFSQRNKQPLRFTFMGGGEPLLSWDVVQSCIEEAAHQADITGQKVFFSIITNGTILTEDMLSSFIKHDVRINVSFDIIPEFQNKQRGKYTVVSRNIDRLLQKGVKALIRSTITPQSAPALFDIVKYAIKRYPFLEIIAVEPVTDPKLSPEELREFLTIFRHNFFKAKNLLNGSDKKIISSEVLSFQQLSRKHCPMSVSINPELSLTACPCFSSPHEEGYQKNIVGRLKDNKLFIDDAAYQKVMPSLQSLPCSCLHCFARWNCAGGCVHQRILYTPLQMEEICDHSRQMIRRLLFEKIKMHINI